MNPQTAKLPGTTTSSLDSPAVRTKGRPRSAEAPPANFWELLKQVHHNEQGAVSIETILIIAAIALPILIFIIKFGWPRIRKFFNEGMDELEGGALDAAGE